MAVLCEILNSPYIYIYYIIYERKENHYGKLKLLSRSRSIKGV